jgi:uncharacterized damage-inducible protein DinB
MTVDDIRALYDYNTWANHRVLENCAALDGEQFARRIVSSFSSVRETLVHLAGCEWLWLERWKGRSHTALPWAADSLDFQGLGERWAELETGLMSFVSGLGEDDLARVVRHTTTEGVPQAAPLWQMMQHVVNHGTYHRGQVVTMLRQLGAQAQSTDLIVFYRQRAAQASA